VEEWIRVDDVREEAERAVDRGGNRRPPRERSGGGGGTEQAAELEAAVSPQRAARLTARLKEAAKAFDQERFADAKRILRPMAEEAPSAASVRELLGLTYYRLGQWKPATRELEAFADLTKSTEQHPVLADCYRALGRHKRVQELWEELRAASPSAALVAEGRIVLAGSLADRGELAEAIGVLQKVRRPNKRPQEHHLRVAYALADLYERSGDLAKARDTFAWVAGIDPEFADAQRRARALR
jgi:tetratricopeptide (TPR) repeat protein